MTEALNDLMWVGLSCIVCAFGMGLFAGWAFWGNHPNPSPPSSADAAKTPASS